MQAQMLFYLESLGTDTGFPPFWEDCFCEMQGRTPFMLTCDQHMCLHRLLYAMTLFCVCSLCKSVSCTHVNVKGVYSLLRIEDILQSIGKDTHQAKQFMLGIPAGEIAKMHTISYHTHTYTMQRATAGSDITWLCEPCQLTLSLAELHV